MVGTEPVGPATTGVGEPDIVLGNECKEISSNVWVTQVTIGRHGPTLVTGHAPAGRPNLVDACGDTDAL